MARILIVDDEQDLLDLISYKLVKEGHEMRTAANGVLALAAMEKEVPDAVILDLMMPRMDGFEVLRHMRAHDDLKKVPVLMLTARGALEDRIKGLEMGADDYVSKPFSQKELALRLRSVLRRVHASDSALTCGPFRLDREALRLLVDEVPVDLTATEFKLMHVLMQRPGKAQGRDVLLKEVWGYKDTTLTRTLDTHIKRLREKLGKRSSLLQTVRSIGYVLQSSES